MQDLYSYSIIIRYNTSICVNGEISIRNKKLLKTFFTKYLQCRFQVIDITIMWEVYETILYILNSSPFSILHTRRFYEWRTNTKKWILVSKKYAVVIRYMGLYILVILSVLREIPCRLFHFLANKFYRPSYKSV